MNRALVMALTTLLYDMSVRNYRPNQPLGIMPAIAKSVRFRPCHGTTKTYLPPTLYNVNLNTSDIKRADKTDETTNTAAQGVSTFAHGYGWHMRARTKIVGF
jgi:hypothetical protein